jgi:hypothetical protein
LDASGTDVIISDKLENYFTNLDIQNESLKVTLKERLHFSFEDRLLPIKERREGVTTPGDVFTIKSTGKIVFSENHTGLKITPIIVNGFTCWIFEIQEMFPELKIDYQGFKVDSENNVIRMDVDELKNYTKNFPKMKEAVYYLNGTKTKNIKYDFSMSENKKEFDIKENMSNNMMSPIPSIIFLLVVCLSISVIMKLRKIKREKEL